MLSLWRTVSADARGHGASIYWVGLRMHDSANAGCGCLGSVFYGNIWTPRGDDIANFLDLLSNHAG